MTDAVSAFKFTLIVMLFYSVAINICIYSIGTFPDNGNALDFVESFSDLEHTDTDMESIANTVEDSFDQQSDIPVVEFGALVFYTGNIIMDLVANFIFAIPEMIGLITHGITDIIGADKYIFVWVQAFSSVVMIVMYFIGMIGLISSIRSGQRIG